MAENVPQEQPPQDHEDGRTSPGPLRGGARHLLAVAALLPLALAAGALALAPPQEPVSVEHAEVESRPGASTRWCHGPLQLPEQILEEGPDSELSVTPPSTSVSLRTVSAEPASSLLFGTVSGSATLQEDDGSVRAPSIVARDAEGAVLGDEPASQDMGVSVLGLQSGQGTANITSATSDGGRPVADTLQTTSTASGDYRSLVVTRCGEPTTEASFLGASTGTGDSSVLVLHNPTRSPRRRFHLRAVDRGRPGRHGGRRSQVVVAPGAEERVLLESVAAGREAVGVDVSVLGSPLSMHVQTTEREGLTPGGAQRSSIRSPPPRRSS